MLRSPVVQLSCTPLSYSKSISRSMSTCNGEAYTWCLTWVHSITTTTSQSASTVMVSPQQLDFLEGLSPQLGEVTLRPELQPSPWRNAHFPATRVKDLMAEPVCLYLVDCFMYIGGGLTVNFLPVLLFLTANCKAQDCLLLKHLSWDFCPKSPLYNLHDTVTPLF